MKTYFGFKLSYYCIFVFWFSILCPFFICPVHAVTHIAAGDRIIIQGDIWMFNETENQLGVEVIRLSSYRTINELKSISDNPNFKLAIGLTQRHDGNPDTLVSGQSYLSPETSTWWSDTILNNYVIAFKNRLTHWKDANIDVSMIMFDLEYPFTNYPGHTSQELTVRMTNLLKQYKQTILDVYGQETPPELWVYSAKLDSTALNGTKYGSYQYAGCDWASLTSEPYPIDVCTGSAYINTDPDPTYGSLLERKQRLTDILNEIQAVSNQKPVVAQIHTY